MSNSRLARTLGISLVCAAAALHGQSPPPDDVPPPKAPFVANMPETAAWTLAITLKHPPAAAAPGALPPRLRKAIEVVKTGLLKREVTVYTDGFRNERWYSGRIRMTEEPHLHYIELFDPTIDEGGTKVSSDFPELSWVKIAYYKGVENLGGARCYSFLAPVTPDADHPTPSPTDRYQASIDVNTKLPVVMEDAQCAYRLHVGAPPTQPLTLPPDFQRELDDHLAAVKMRKAHAGSVR